MDSTTRLALNKPNPDPVTGDVVDISKLNENADKIDAAISYTVCTSATRPATPFQGQGIVETDTGYTYVRIGTIWVAVSVYPALFVRQATSQTFANNTETAMTWDTVVKNTGFTYSAGSDAFTVPANGTYSVESTVRWQGNATGVRRLAIQVDGALWGEQISNAVTSSFSHSINVSAIIPLNTGNNVRIFALQTSGANLAFNVTSRTPHASIVRVG